MDDAMTDGTADTGDEHVLPPPPRAWGRAMLAVPVLVVVAFVLPFVAYSIDNRRIHRESAGCQWLPVPSNVWALTIGSLVAVVCALGLHIGLRRYARGRSWRTRTPAGMTADGSAVLGWVALLMAAVAVWGVTDEQSDYDANHRKPVCEGLAVPGR